MKQFTSELEYLESCGNGSFASFTKSGVNTRRYHGLLVGGTAPDDHRAVFVSRCDEVLEVDGNQNELGTRLFQDAIAPQGFQNLKGSAWDLYPELVYHHAGVELRKAVLALHGHSTVMLRYQIIAPGLCGNLCLEPFVSLRPYHALYVGRSEAIDVCFDDGVLGVQNQANGLDVFMGLAGSSFCYRGEWHRNVYYPADRERGYDYLEDVYLPGVLSVPFEAQAEFFIVLSTQREAVRLGREAWDLEVGRRRQLLDRPKARVLPRRLCYVASQFLVQDQASLNIIAGYPWFTCWARDSMIAIPGLCLSTGQFGAARQILTTWAAHLKDGLLPNRLGAGDPRYNSVDATLWFVNACYRYVLKSGDRAFIDSVADKIQEIIEYHIRGTHYGIKVDPEDGLLAAGDVSTQLTWMDACFEGVPVTPRYGKAIEINALWYNAVRIAQEWQLTRTSLNQFEDNFFKRFWSPEKGYLADRVVDEAIWELRPNQLMAGSLPFSILPEAVGKLVLETVERELLTPWGLRTLSPKDEAYQACYRGTLETRDKAYHQGTVWPWLLSPYAAMLVRFKGELELFQIREIAQGFMERIDAQELSVVPEIFDGDPPHQPRGCYTQAWSVSALLELWELLHEVP